MHEILMVDDLVTDVVFGGVGIVLETRKKNFYLIKWLKPPHMLSAYLEHCHISYLKRIQKNEEIIK